MMYEVAIHEYGRKLITRDGPTQGLLEWPQSRWMSITLHPIGLASAKALADAQDCHAVVCAWKCADEFYDNGKAPRLPDGWWPASAQHTGQSR